MRLSPIVIALFAISLAALGLGVYNFMIARKSVGVLAAHHNILDHAEFDKLDPSIKTYYLSMVEQVMPELAEYANVIWAELPAYAKDASKNQKAADLLKAKRPQFANMIKSVKSMVGTEMIPDTGYPLYVPRKWIQKPTPKPVIVAPKPTPKPVPVPAKTTLKIA